MYEKPAIVSPSVLIWIYYWHWDDYYVSMHKRCSTL